MFNIYFSYLITFYLTSGMCFLYDYINTNNPKYDKKMLQYKNINKIVAINSFCYIPPISYLYEYFIISNYEFNLLYSILRIVFGLLSIDLFFYIAHRFMHIPILYKWSHKLHHTYKEPIGMEALYLHWFDLYFGNILPIFTPILYCDLYTTMMWTSLIITITVVSHSNIIKDKHQDHHLLFNYNYGTNVFMDKLLKTDYIKHF